MRIHEFLSEAELNKLHDQSEYIRAFKGFRQYHYDVPYRQARQRLDAYSAAIDQLNQSGGTVYRAIWCHPKKQPNLKRPGDHWTISIDAARAYLDSNAGASARMDLMGEDDVEPVAYIIAAQVGTNNITNRSVMLSQFPDELEVNIVRPGQAQFSVVERIDNGQPAAQAPLSELAGIKNQVKTIPADAGHGDWAALLKTHGFEPIGQGHHGQVYQNPKLDYVLKVFTAVDTSYKTWVGYCRGPLQGNAYVPVFRGGVVRINDEAMATRMERLQPATLAHMEMARQIQQRLLHARREKRDWQTDPYFRELDDSLIEVISYIDQAAKTGLMLDLRGANVMSRQGQMVIIDPLA